MYDVCMYNVQCTVYMSKLNFYIDDMSERGFHRQNGMNEEWKIENVHEFDRKCLFMPSSESKKEKNTFSLTFCLFIILLLL